MAVMKKRQTMRYESYGNVAYAPVPEGGAVAAPRQQESIPLPRRRVQERTETRALTRTQVQVREAGMVAPFGVVGFLTAAVFAALFMLSLAQNVALGAEVVSLQNQYSEAQVSNSSLSAQYEKIFDIASIEAAVAGTMVRPSSEQVVYIDLSQPDEVNLYGGEARTEGFAGLVDGITEIGNEIMAYFQ